jgi:hypothetical protein
MRILIAIYACVAAGLASYAAYGATHGEQWTFDVVWGGLTLTWLLFYWPIAMPLYVLARLRAIWRLVVTRYQETGKLTLDAESRAFLLDQLVGLVAGRFGLPEFIAQWLVAKMIARLKRKRPAQKSAAIER